jgi:DUF1009 family protein
MRESRVGLLAGSGQLPLEFLKSAKEKGVKVVSFALKGITDPEIEKYSESVFWIKPFKLKAFFNGVKESGVKELYLLGKVEHKKAIDLTGLDLKAIQFLFRLKNRKPETIILAIIDELKKVGVEVPNPESFLEHLKLRKGEQLGKGRLSRETLEDLEFGMKVAKEIASLDVGQTVIIKNKTVIAVEAIEGTDECIKRGAALAGEGFVVCKAARKNQDMRVDVPTVGINTVKLVEELGGKAIAVEAERTFVLNKDRIKTGKVPVLAL